MTCSHPVHRYNNCVENRQLTHVTASYPLTVEHKLLASKSYASKLSFNDYRLYVGLRCRACVCNTIWSV